MPAALGTLVSDEITETWHLGSYVGKTNMIIVCMCTYVVGMYVQGIYIYVQQIFAVKKNHV